MLVDMVKRKKMVGFFQKSQEHTVTFKTRSFIASQHRTGKCGMILVERKMKKPKQRRGSGGS